MQNKRNCLVSVLEQVSKLIKYLIIFGLLLSVVVSADEPNVKITQFGLGLNTNTDIINLKPNEASILLNYDIVGSQNGFYLRKRKGYMTLYPIVSAAVNDTLNGDDPTIGIFSFRRVDGLRRICGIISQPGDTSGRSAANGIDSQGVGWLVASPALPATPVGSGSYYYLQDQSTRVLYEYVYQGITPHWTYWNDRAYMTNGKQRPLVFHPYNEFGRDGYVRELVPLTPGEPLIVPMDVVGNLKGEYFYIINHNSPCGAAIGSDSLTDGDFENWTGNKPNSWDTLLHGTSTIIEETDTVKSGSSVRLTNERLFKGDDSVGVTQEVQVAADSTYLASVWINVKGTEGSVTRMTIRDTSGTFLDEVAQFGTTNGWIKLETNIDPGDAAIDFLVSFVGDNEGQPTADTCYVDSALFQRVDPLGERLGVVTKPVIANSENVLLTNFEWQTIAAGCAFDAAEYDTMDLEIYRTKANPGEINDDDKFWLIKTFNLPAADSFAALDTLVYVDTLADSAIGHGDFVTFLNIDTSKVGRDSNLVLSGVRVGAPTYIDTAEFDGSMFLTDLSINEVFITTSYIMTYYDTLINAESDSSRSLHITRNVTIDTSGYKIGLPPVPGGKSHLTRRLWKSFTYYTIEPLDSVIRVIDTNITIDWSLQLLGTSNAERQEFYVTPKKFIEIFLDNHTAVMVIPPYNKYQKGNVTKTYRIKYKNIVPHPNADSTRLDTTVTIYRMITEIKGTDSAYVDTIGMDSTLKARPYFKSEAPFNLNYVTSFQDRLWGAVGATLYWSFIDTGTVWGSYRNLSLNDDDGDDITAIIPRGKHIKVYKNRSQFGAFPGAEYEFERTWTVDGIGCIAPHSAKSTEDGIFYLSHKGVIRERGSEFRDEVSSFGLISEPINNILLNRTMDALSKGYSFVHNNKYHLAFSDIDTTFVFHIKSGGWTIYSYAAKQATNYDTLTINNKNKVPSSDLVFIDGKGDQLYLIDTLPTDTSYFDTGANPDTLLPGAIINTQYRSAPFTVTADYQKIGKFGIWRQSNDATGGLDVRLYNAEGDSVFYKYVDSIARRFDIHGVNVDISNYFQIDVQDTTLDSLAIPRIDGWVIPMRSRPDE